MLTNITLCERQNRQQPQTKTSQDQRSIQAMFTKAHDQREQSNRYHEIKQKGMKKLIRHK